MKKIISVALILLCVLSLSSCGKILHGSDELIEQAREVFPLTDAENCFIQYAGLCGKDDEVLVWFVSGDENEVHHYLPMECSVVGDNQYKYTGIFTPSVRGQDIAVAQWNDGYSFIINNPDCAAVRITDTTGTQEISIEKYVYPYVFYHPTIPSDYAFLDADGNEIF